MLSSRKFTIAISVFSASSLLLLGAILLFPPQQKSASGSDGTPVDLLNKSADRLAPESKLSGSNGDSKDPKVEGSSPFSDSLEQFTLVIFENDRLSKFDVNDYLNEELSVESAMRLYEAQKQCRVKLSLKNNKLCQRLRDGSFLTEYEAIDFAAASGNLEAQVAFGYTIPPGSESWTAEQISTHRGKRIHYLEQAWEAGSINALQELSSSYYFGSGVEQDLEKAYFYSKTAQKIYERLGGDIPDTFKKMNNKLVSEMELVLYPYQREPIVKSVGSQVKKECCILF
ncbi:hypothetical protein [Microbulbifer sp.]|uniref:hypothetical protein n=1 Tax=Microbulbifer sp. TaxID=1908541 RepID=UPI00258792FC|nr:hypothetical protein [Microbulbifer sp.]